MKCLLMIDLQNGFISEETDYVISPINELLKRFEKDLVIATKFINEDGSPFSSIMRWYNLRESPEIDLSEKICWNNVMIVEKNGYSACTDVVMNILAKYDIEQVYIVGIDTDCCVLKTAVDLFEKNIRPLVLERYCASNGGIESHQAAIKVLGRVIGEEQIIKGFVETSEI